MGTYIIYLEEQVQKRCCSAIAFGVHGEERCSSKLLHSNIYFLNVWCEVTKVCKQVTPVEISMNVYGKHMCISVVQAGKLLTHLGHSHDTGYGGLPLVKD